jgi:hypothetical protein
METIASPQPFAAFGTTFVATTTYVKGLHVIKLQTERVVTQPTFEVFRPLKLHLPPSRPESVKGFPFEFELGQRMV